MNVNFSPVEKEDAKVTASISIKLTASLLSQRFYRNVP